ASIRAASGAAQRSSPSSDGRASWRCHSAPGQPDQTTEGRNTVAESQERILWTPRNDDNTSAPRASRPPTTPGEASAAPRHTRTWPARNGGHAQLAVDHSPLDIGVGPRRPRAAPNVGERA